VGGSDVSALAEMEPTVKYHPNRSRILILSLESGQVTLPDGQFAWGESLLNCNEGVQRFPQDGWQSSVECKGIRELDCESDRTSRYESRAK
jgi:hypothetical protein